MGYSRNTHSAEIRFLWATAVLHSSLSECLIVAVNAFEWRRMSQFKVWIFSISDLIFGIAVPVVSWFILSCINE